MKFQIEGEFNGYNDGAIFKLTDGSAWQQKEYKYQYTYAYRPDVNLYTENGKDILSVDLEGLGPVEVARVHILEEGSIVSDFKGFDEKEKFEFQNGHVWEQSECKYKYHYAHSPHAIIVDGVNGKQMHVDGMSENVKVTKIK